MKLIASLTSPYGRKARIVMAEKNIACELVEELPWSTDTHVPDYNPLGKIPVLVLDNGETLFDSRVIVEYLEWLAPAPRLIPDSGFERIQVKRWEALADGLCDAAAAALIESRRQNEAQRSPQWITR